MTSLGRGVETDCPMVRAPVGALLSLGNAPGLIAVPAGQSHP
ncbi:hypothetical protein FM101_08870 [Arthrobacter rhombi]|uniref:Uncharacterized protein n=1 Tax=Arthrobacter rhombi TaxID=71253 RepID=A0A1R4G9Z2_9MICC|nr:hypothetical protein FM101_08870 [Arthrobacter rhombi]